jgi:hypothetical protein
MTMAGLLSTKAGSCGKAGINFTILEYANTGHKRQFSIRLSGI